MSTNFDKESNRRKGFASHPENINRKGRPPTSGLTAMLRHMMAGDGRMIIRDVEECDNNGNPTGAMFKYALAEMPTNEAIVKRLMEMLGSENDSIVLRAIDMIFDRIDGKPKQQIEVGLPPPPPVADLTPEEKMEFIKKLKPGQIDRKD